MSMSAEMNMEESYMTSSYHKYYADTYSYASTPPFRLGKWGKEKNEIEKGSLALALVCTKGAICRRMKVLC